jgi:hypothetical protein
MANKAPKKIHSNLNSLNTFTQKTSSPNVKLVLIRTGGWFFGSGWDGAVRTLASPNPNRALVRQVVGLETRTPDPDSRARR